MYSTLPLPNGTEYKVLLQQEVLELEALCRRKVQNTTHTTCSHTMGMCSCQIPNKTNPRTLLQQEVLELEALCRRKVQNTRSHDGHVFLSDTCT